MYNVFQYNDLKSNYRALTDKKETELKQKLSRYESYNFNQTASNRLPPIMQNRSKKDVSHLMKDIFAVLTYSPMPFLNANRKDINVTDESQ